MDGRIIALTCICFSVPERELIVQHGFLSYPQFLDNGFVKAGWSLIQKLKWFRRNLARYKQELHVVVAPDNMLEKGLELKKKYPANWLYPLHYFHEVEDAVKHFEYVAFPHGVKAEVAGSGRDYNLQEYLSKVPFEKRWYLGFWRQSTPEVLLQFKGFDTTLPETYSGKYGKLWVGWNQSITAPNGMKTIDIFHQNLKAFQREVKIIFQQKTLEVS